MTLTNFFYRPYGSIYGKYNSEECCWNEGPRAPRLRDGDNTQSEQIRLDNVTKQTLRGKGPTVSNQSFCAALSVIDILSVCMVVVLFFFRIVIL